MRLIFMGTPQFAVASLDAVIAAGHDVIAVYTQPPRPGGRGKGLRPSPVQLRAEALDLCVRSPEKLRSADDQAAFAELGADVAVVAAYGLILPKPVLDAPRLGCINVHASLLPRWRGAAPVQRAILAGDLLTGVTIMQMEAGLDTGPMRTQSELAVGRQDAGTLTDALATLGADLLCRVLAVPDQYPACPQSAADVTYATKIDKSESKLDFNLSAVQVERQVRAFAPAPGAWFDYHGDRIRILAADVLMTSAPAWPGQTLDDALTISCNPGSIRPTWVQRAGRAAMTPAELLRGFPIPAGMSLA